MRYSFIEQHRHQYAIGLQCRVLGVSTSGYYAWRGRPASQRSQQNRQLEVRIRAVFEQHRHRYGSPVFSASYEIRALAAPASEWHVWCEKLDCEHAPSGGSSARRIPAIVILWRSIVYRVVFRL